MAAAAARVGAGHQPDPNAAALGRRGDQPHPPARPARPAPGPGPGPGPPWIMAAAGVGLVPAIAAVGVVSGTDQPASKASSVQPPAAAAPAPSTPESAPEPVEPTYDVPKVDDFEFEVKETSREHSRVGR